jgi:hypothetical protein
LCPNKSKYKRQIDKVELKARKKNEWTIEKCTVYVDLINLHALMFVYPELRITQTILTLPEI